MRFSATVERSDVAEAIRLVKVALQQAATDPATGCIGMRMRDEGLLVSRNVVMLDMDLINTGTSNVSRMRLNNIISHTKEILARIRKPSIRFERLLGSLLESNVVGSRSCVARLG